MSGPRTPWQGSFEIDGTDGGPIGLHQITADSFELRSKLHYRGRQTGLEGKVPEPALTQIRLLDPALTPGGVHITDLASVPGPTRWFLGTYGAHTPAVIIHDWLIPSTDALPGMTDEYADRYLRFMLDDLGVRWIRRWVMWAAVALRTRWAAGGIKRLSVAVWVLAAAAGMVTLVVSALQGSATGVAAALLAPFVFALLWGRQYGAGLIGAIAAPWYLPPTVAAAIGYLVYLVVELAAGALAGKKRRGTGTVLPEGV